jgi:murein DD-endopeptidase MepM/ murein hydrolase activator NlpD
MLGAAVVGAALVVVPSSALGAVDDPTTPTEPPTTVLPTPTPPAPPSSTEPTTIPAVPTIPDHPNGELSAFSPAQTLAAEAELATLTDGQRALLRQLQASREVLATRRFALVALARDVALAREALDAARATERQFRARVEETTARLQALGDEIAALAVSAYQDHAESWALGAIGSIDVGDAGILTRATTYARSNVALLNDRVTTLAALQRRLESERRSAEAARVAAEAGAADLDARLADQRAAYDEAAEAAAKAQAIAARSLGSAGLLVAQMVDPRVGSDGVSATLAFAQAGQVPPATTEGIFALPVPVASLSSPFGVRIDPIAGTVAFHAGLDFGAALRTPIRAAAAGRVVIAGDCGGYGNCVVIDHGRALATLYGHQSQVQVRVGDEVAAGQVIGLVGATGISTGPHLHFEVRLRGAPIDPVPTLTG